MSIDQNKDNPVIHLSWNDRFFLLLLRSIGKLSLRSLHRICDAFYWLCKLIPFKFKRVIATHITLCFPDLTSKQQKQLIDDSIRHTLYCLAEMPLIWFGKPGKVLNYIKQVSGENAIMEATREGKNIIILAPHLGSWEIFNLYASPLHPSAGLYKPRKKAWQESLIREARERSGNVSMYPTSIAGVKSLYRALIEKKWVGILADHDPGENGGIYVPFFGIAANTMTLVSKLTSKAKAPVEIFLGFAERLPHSKGFNIHFIKASEQITSPDLEQAATVMNQEIERCIRMAPSQYEWSYKRFRRRPDNGPSFYQ